VVEDVPDSPRRAETRSGWHRRVGKERAVKFREDAGIVDDLRAGDGGDLELLAEGPRNAVGESLVDEAARVIEPGLASVEVDFRLGCQGPFEIVRPLRIGLAAVRIQQRPLPVPPPDYVQDSLVLVVVHALTQARAVPGELQQENGARPGCLEKLGELGRAPIHSATVDPPPQLPFVIGGHTEGQGEPRQQNPGQAPEHCP